MKQPNEFIALVIQSKTGDLEAFERLVARFQDMAVGYAYSILNDFGLAQDAAQEAFIQMYYDLPNLREPVAFPSWFRRIVFKYCDRRIRGRRADVVSWEAVTMMAASEAGPAEVVESRETAAAIYTALRALPENERAVIMLYYFQETSLKEMAAFLETSVATVDHRLRSARKHLGERILTMMQKDLQEKRPSRDAGFLTKVMDGLTRVANRQGLKNRLVEEIQISRTSRQGFGLVILDIDTFQSFNQEWGHIVGDCLLSAMAKQLLSTTHADDFVARYGGEEFALIIRRPTKYEVGAFAEKVRESIAQSSYRLEELLLPNARYPLTDVPLPPSPVNRFFQEGMTHLWDNRLTEAAHAFTKALEQDKEHVPSIMELEYLKLRQTLGTEQAEKNTSLSVTVSGGVVWYKDGDTPESLLERAAEYLALAKQRGRNQIQQEP